MNYEDLKRQHLLIEILLDESADVGERDDAAMIGVRPAILQLVGM